MTMGHLMVTTWLCDATTMRCHYEAAPPWGVPSHGNQTASGNIVAVCCHRLFCEWRSLASRCSQRNVVSLHINFIYCRNNSQSTTYPPNPCTNWLRPVFQLMKTDENCTELVDIGSVQFFEVCQLVRTSPGLGLVKI